MSLKKDGEILIPEYLMNFKCIGSECEDTCCRGWTISLDKSTYKKYKKCGNPILNHTFNKSIIRNRNNQSEYYYGKIKMSEEGSCPLLTENNLCNVHSVLGISYLSDTCYFYPKHTNEINGLMESSASVSCPAIARLALLDPNPMGFVETINIDNRLPSLRYVIDDTTKFDADKELLHYFWDLRIFTIGVLQNREYTLDERLILLGLVVKKIASLQRQNELNRLQNVLDQYQHQFNDEKEIKSILKSYGSSIKIPFSKGFIDQFSSPNIMMNFPSERYQECVLEIIQGLKILENNIDLTNKLYIKSYQEYYEPYMRDKEYILENYIVNEVFKELYPVARFGTIEESYTMLLTLYNIIKFHLIGVSAYYEKLDDEITIKVIQSFSRIILHHSQYLNLFKISDGDSL